MNLTNPFPSYAQYNEDIILLALLFDVENGFYVDIGANYPVVDSVTKLFYQHGWRGINIEPIPSIHNQLQSDRPEDTNLNIGIGAKNGELDFFENKTTPGHSSFKESSAVNFEDTINRHKVKIKTLKDVLDSNKAKKINFMKIDVEGFEDIVVQSNDWSKYRPEVVCIESGDDNTSWQSVLSKNKYRFFIKDGLNEYYVAEESWFRTTDFADRIVKLAHQSVKYHQYIAWSADIKMLKKVTKLNQLHFDMVQRLNYENKLSLRNIGFFKRLKRSLYALTVDFARYKFKK